MTVENSSLESKFENEKKLYGENKLKLSADQQEGLNQACEFLLNRETFFSVIGPAGSGKTTLMKVISSGASERRWRILLTAPTHKAAKQLSDSVGIQAITIHKALGLAIVENSKTGQLEYKLKGRSAITNNTFVIIDESSMVGDEIFEYINDACKGLDVKVMFVGDLAQLNPPNEPVSSVVDPDKCAWPLFALTKIHRQAADNPIIKIATAIRLADSKNLPVPVTDIHEQKGIVVLSKKDWRKRMIKACSNNPNDRYVGYKNTAVDAASKHIRIERYGQEAKDHPYIVGETVIVNQRYVYRYQSTEHDVEKITVDNNIEFVIKRVWKDDGLYRVLGDIDGQDIEFNAMESYKHRMNYLQVISKQCANKAKDALEKNPWGEYWDAANHLADLRSAASLTVHKSQGSTFRDVYINMEQIYACPDIEEQQRLFYVAVTRASRAVFITGVK